MKRFVLLLAILISNTGCQPSPGEQAKQLGREIGEVLPPGWHQVGMGVDPAPSGWSGKTTAIRVSFRHDTLKSAIGGRDAAGFTVWRTPRGYSGTIVIDLMQGEAMLLGASKDHRWFLAGMMLPEGRERPVPAILKRFAIAPPR